MGTRHNASKNWIGALLVFLVYFYFLLFSQFTLLELLESALGKGGHLKAILGTMALAGVLGSVSAVRIRRLSRTGRVFGPALIACALVAFAAPHTNTLWVFLLLAILMGFSMGLLTVSIAALLPKLVPGSLRGCVVGAGTGLAYMACNLPLIFSSSMEMRSYISGAVLLCGGVGLLQVRYAEADSPQDTGHASSNRSYWTFHLMLAMVGVFTLLIWFDSAFFYIVQQTRSLKGVSWEGTAQLYANAGLHLGAAFLGGWMLDTGRGRMLLILAWAGLSIGAIGLQSTGNSIFTMAYVAAVSLYSTALVFIPSLRCAVAGDKASFIRAASVYACAGWLGSGLGIGMAENLSRIPVAFIFISSLVLIPIGKLTPILK
jgi:MFS family permease